MTQEEKVLDRIRKLLELAKSDNVHEAGNAAAQAQALMSKYAITSAMVDVGPDEDEHDEPIEVDMLHTHSSRNLPTWKARLATAMAAVNQCHSYRQGNVLNIIGRPSDATTVRYLFSYVVREIDRLADQEAALRGAPGRTWKNNFRLGATEEVNRRLREAFRNARAEMKQEADASDTLGTGTAIVLVNNAIQKLDNRRQAARDYGTNVLKLQKVHRSSRYNKNAREAGKRAGATIDLNSGGRAGLGSGAKAALKS